MCYWAPRCQWRWRCLIQPEKIIRGQRTGRKRCRILPGPQASTAWFGSAGGQTQGNTGQGVSAADFVYWPGGETQDPFSLVALFGPPGRQWLR